MFSDSVVNVCILGKAGTKSGSLWGIIIKNYFNVYLKGGNFK